MRESCLICNNATENLKKKAINAFELFQPMLLPQHSLKNSLVTRWNDVYECTLL